MSWPHVNLELEDVEPLPKNEFSDLSIHKFDILKAAFETLNFKTLLVTILSVSSTIVCHILGISMNVRTDLIGIAVIFPIGIGINGAFKRREDALKNLAWIKGNAFAIRLAYSHWVAERPSKRELAEQVEVTLGELFQHMQAYLTARVLDPDLLAPVMTDLAQLSRAGEGMRKEGVPAPEISRVNEYLRVICVQFQELKNVRVYRTPIGMRGYSKFFILLFPIIFGPTFNYLSNEAGGIWHGIFLAIVYSVILTGLDNVQDGLENPFDGKGEDDIQFYEPSFVLHASVD
jgi:hypothetical protein